MIWIAIAAAAVLALAYVGGTSGFKVWRQTRNVKRAQEFLDKKDYGQAAMSATWALQLDPTDVTATRIMADTAAAQAQRQELVWREKLVELQPDVLEHRLAWANAALHYDEVPTAQKALAGASEAQKKGAPYHAVAARIAAALRQGKAAESIVAETVRLDPSNELYQLELAALRLGGDSIEGRSLARAEIERLAGSAKVSRPAMYVLIRDAMLRGDPARALGFAEKLNASSEVVFDDRMRYLRLLQQLGRAEFWWCLAQVQAESAGNNMQLATIMTYLNKSGFPQIALEWGKRLPENVRSHGLLPIALAESCLLQRDWDGLKAHVKFSGWNTLEFQRLALYARVLREQGDADGSAAQWKAAIAAATGHPEDIATLARLATSWKWDAEATGILWQIARGASNQMAALQTLSRKFQINGNARELLNVANRMLELEPGSALAKNNVAYLSLLLEVDKERAHALAKEVYQSDPANVAFVSTYALAMHLLGKSDEGLRLMRALKPQDLEAPGNAFCYGVLLAASDPRGDAAKYLKLAETSSILLPQERAMLAKAREWLPKQ